MSKSRTWTSQSVIDLGDSSGTRHQQAPHTYTHGKVSVRNSAGKINVSDALRIVVDPLLSIPWDSVAWTLGERDRRIGC